VEKPVVILENICNSGITSKIVDFFSGKTSSDTREYLQVFFSGFFFAAPVFQTEIASPVAMSPTTRC
jgi:hypothetical protein